jgi:hypothetical protein
MLAQRKAGDQPILCLVWITSLWLKRQTMNEYQVTFASGEVVEVEAWTSEIAQAVAEEEAGLDGQSVVSVELRRLAA